MSFAWSFLDCIESQPTNNYEITMSETGNSPSPAPVAPASCDCKAVPHLDVPKPVQPQPQNTPATGPVLNKNFRRQGRKQH